VEDITAIAMRHGLIWGWACGAELIVVLRAPRASSG
jgi:hypothetical protein